LLGLAGECIGANTAARQQELQLELLLSEALLLGRRMSGDLPRPTRPHLRRMSGGLPRPTRPHLRRMSGDLPRPTRPHLRRMSGDLPRPTAPDPRSPRQPLMAGRAMATAQGPIRTPRSSILSRGDGAEPNPTGFNFSGRPNDDRK